MVEKTAPQNSMNRNPMTARTGTAHHVGPVGVVPEAFGAGHVFDDAAHDSRSSGPSTRSMGTDRTGTRPPGEAGQQTGERAVGRRDRRVLICCRRYAATNPPRTTPEAAQVLPTETMGSADSTPMTSAPPRTGWALVVVLTAEVRDQVFALEYRSVFFSFVS